ncbi:hypothetical protein LSAT2_017285 [Lamellibrachia satsuma]|nr:hypothetical protein LSAT2_017285 [Lamellibrachia satsuma]
MTNRYRSSRSETDQVKNVVTTSVEEELGRRHRGVYWTGLSFAVSLEATTQREGGETLYEKHQRLEWRSKNRPSQVVPYYRLRQVVPNYRLRQVVPNYRLRQVVPNSRSDKWCLQGSARNWMPPIKESTQQTAGASAALDLPTQSDVVDPGLEQVSATAYSGAAAENAARCGWQTDMEKRMSAIEHRMSATEQRVRATEQRMSATEQGISAILHRISATEQRVSATEHCVSATEQRVGATEQGISATDQSMGATEQGISATSQRKSATSQRMSATDQRISAIEQRISATVQRKRATDQRISAIEQRISATEQRISATEQRISATDQRINATEQLWHEVRREMDEIRELLHAAASLICSQKATMATINTGTSSANQMQDCQTPDNPLKEKSMQTYGAGEEKGERSTQWVRALKGFCETTTFQGLRNVAESTSNSVLRNLWIIIVLISILVFSCQCQYLVRLFLR